MQQSKTWTIGELAREFGITTRSIRYYEDEGLLAPSRKGQNRIYTHKDVTRLKLILRGKRLGFSLGESKELINLYQPGSRNKKQLEKYLNRIRQKQESLHRQLDDIQLTLEELKQAEQNCLEYLEVKREESR